MQQHGEKQLAKRGLLRAWSPLRGVGGSKAGSSKTSDAAVARGGEASASWQISAGSAPENVSSEGEVSARAQQVGG